MIWNTQDEISTTSVFTYCVQIVVPMLEMQPWKGPPRSFINCLSFTLRLIRLFWFHSIHGSLCEDLIPLIVQRPPHFQSRLTLRHFKTICYHAKLTFLRNSFPSLMYLQIEILAFVSFFVARLNKTDSDFSQKAASQLTLFPPVFLPGSFSSWNALLLNWGKQVWTCEPIMWSSSKKTYCAQANL